MAISGYNCEIASALSCLANTMEIMPRNESKECHSEPKAKNLCCYVNRLAEIASELSLLVMTGMGRDCFGNIVPRNDGGREYLAKVVETCHSAYSLCHSELKVKNLTSGNDTVNVTC